MNAFQKIIKFFNRDVGSVVSAPYSEYGYEDPKIANERIDRAEYGAVLELVQPNTRVLDVGCGDGSLGEQLIKKNRCLVSGLDIDKNAVKQSIEKHIKARVCDVDGGINFPDNSFDYVVMNVALQMVYRPDFVFSELLRVGEYTIVSFPNFSHIIARLEMLVGRFPKSTLFGYKWYNTRHIHLFSVKDFKEYVKLLGVDIIAERHLFIDSRSKHVLSDLFPNMFAGTSVFLLRRTKAKLGY